MAAGGSVLASKLCVAWRKVLVDRAIEALDSRSGDGTFFKEIRELVGKRISSDIDWSNENLFSFTARSGWPQFVFS